MGSILVDSMVGRQGQEPLVRITLNDNPETQAQLSVAMARKLAADIVQAAARAEADAMIWRFFTRHDFPENAGIMLMRDFREYRATLDREEVEGFLVDPETGQTRPQ